MTSEIHVFTYCTYVDIVYVAPEVNCVTVKSVTPKRIYTFPWGGTITYKYNGTQKADSKTYGSPEYTAY